MDLKLLKREIETDGSPVRLTKTKCAILGDTYTRHEERLTFVRKPRGRIQISWSGYVPVSGVETVRCDQGHDHTVPKVKHWTWNYVVLDPRDIDRLREFLT